MRAFLTGFALLILSACTTPQIQELGLALNEPFLDGETAVMADGTQMTTRGRLNRLTPTRWRSSRIIRWVTSKSVMAPLRRGRTATM